MDKTNENAHRISDVKTQSQDYSNPEVKSETKGIMYLIKKIIARIKSWFSCSENHISDKLKELVKTNKKDPNKSMEILASFIDEIEPGNLRGVGMSVNEDTKKLTVSFENQEDLPLTIGAKQDHFRRFILGVNTDLEEDKDLPDAPKDITEEDITKFVSKHEEYHKQMDIDFHRNWILSLYQDGAIYNVNPEFDFSDDHSVAEFSKANSKEKVSKINELYDQDLPFKAYPVARTALEYHSCHAVDAYISFEVINKIIATITDEEEKVGVLRNMGMMHGTEHTSTTKIKALGQQTFFLDIEHKTTLDPKDAIKLNPKFPMYKETSGRMQVLIKPDNFYILGEKTNIIPLTKKEHKKLIKEHPRP